MPKYELELGPKVINITCECCNQQVKRVWGFVSKDGWAHSVYYALLAGHADDDRRVGFTVSIGQWWKDDAESVSARRWCHVWARCQEEQFRLLVGEPEESNFHPWKTGGQPMTREEMLASALRHEFFEVLDFVNVEDPAINSYLLGEEVNISGRECEHKDVAEHPHRQ